MSNFKLNLPTDIPWERICVSEDAIDRAVCDDILPPKWQSSMAVFKFRPADEYQLFPQYNITYIKVTATITGYQPLDQEIQGTIDWDGLDVTTINNLTELLNSYNPCHGALLQVVVGPKEGSPNVPAQNYPFFMDFEPKKRELYEMASDTNEKQSRSLETLNITKSAGSTQSSEILDIDMGGSSSFGMQGGAGGAGVGLNMSSSSQGQWGTKRLNAEENMASRTTDVGQEKRESYSHTTQISQMYHLLDSYHAGTNRALFFIQPRPHVLEEPSGFVTGPRPVDGIQEFFLVVAQLKDQADFCVSARLDTSHLTVAPVMDFERKSDLTDLVSCVASLPDEKATPAEYKVGARACFLGDCWDVHYQCYVNHASKEYAYSAPTGFRIEGYDNIIKDANHGTSSVTISPNGASLNVHVESTGHTCFKGDDLCLNCPDSIESFAGYARRQLQINLISTTPTKQIGEEQFLMITTRALCCCPTERSLRKLNEAVVSIKALPPGFRVVRKSERPDIAYEGLERNHLYRKPNAEENDSDCNCYHNDRSDLNSTEMNGRNRIQQANALSQYIKEQTIRSLNDPFSKPQRFLDTDFFAKQFQSLQSRFKKGRETIHAPIRDDVPQDMLSRMEKYLKKTGKDISRYEFLSLRKEELTKMTGSKPEDIHQLKLKALGLKFKSSRSK